MSTAIQNNPGATVESDRAERAKIDLSARIPVLFLFGSGILWLLVATMLGTLASLELNVPRLFSCVSFLTFGRIYPACVNATLYGWCFCSGLGVSIWLMARLARVPVINPIILVVAGAFWNLGVTLGIVGILSGESQAIEWMEFPSYVAPILFISFVLIAAWTILLFRFSQQKSTYVSQWYLLVALFAFPWLFGAANYHLFIRPVVGVMQSITGWWYADNVVGLVLTPIALAAAYYMIPKVTGRPIHSYYLAVIGFWTLILFSSWTGMTHLIDGPIPTWSVSLSIAASFLMLIPVITIGVNHHLTMKGKTDMMYYSPTLRFVATGAGAFTVVNLLASVMAFRTVAHVFHFTDYTFAHNFLRVYGFYSIVIFGAIYYITPRLVAWEWPSEGLISLHYWMALLGVGLLLSTLFVSGFIRGLALSDEKISFPALLNLTNPFLWVVALAGLLLSIGHIAFATSFFLALLRSGRERESATLLGPVENDTELANV